MHTTRLSVTRLLPALLGAVLLASAPTHAADPPASPWQLIHEDRFDAPALSSPWHAADGAWRIKDGRLEGRGQLVLTVPLTGAQRLSFDARAAEPGDLSAMLGVDRTGLTSGYFLGFGSNGNTCSKLLIAGREVARTDHRATPGQVHHIEVERHGHQLTMTVDGQTVLQHHHALPLVGDGHAFVDLYLHRPGQIDNVRVYARPDALDPQAAAIIEAKQQSTAPASSGNLVANGSFETPRTGASTMPAAWSVRFFDRADDAELVTDAGLAHRGQRVMRLHSAAGRGVTLDAIPSGGIMLEPGKAYHIACRARRLAGEPTLTIEPGGFSAPLTDTWQTYQVRWTMPGDAKPRMGMFARIHGGAALIDDVTFAPADHQVAWPASLLADRSNLDALPTHDDWQQQAHEPVWRLRVPVTVAEVVGTPAKGVVLRLKLCDVLPGQWYGRVSPASLKVVDATTGRPVRHALVDADRYEGASSEDELMFRADSPARSRTRYHVYYTDAPRAARTLPKEAPLTLARPSSYPHELDVAIEPPQRPLTIETTPSETGVTLRVHARSGAPVTAQLHGPDEGQPAIDLKLEKAAGDAPVWEQTLAREAVAEPGVWQVTVHTDDGRAWSEGVVFTNAMWWANNAATLQPGHESPRHGADWIQLGAARNERESFQLALRSREGLAGVTLEATDLTHADTQAVIPAGRVRFEYAERIHVTLPWPAGSRAGWYRDPLVPWRTRDIPGDGAEVAWVTVDVAHDTPPGEYWGDVTATSADGTTLTLPLRLEVFGFTLPERPTMAVILGGDIWEKAELGYHKPTQRSNPYREISDGRAVLALAQLLAEHRASPFYYHHDKSPYAVPWHYDPATGEATFDFARLDRNLTLMLETWGQHHLFFGGKFAGGWRNVGRVYDWSRDLDRAWNEWWEEAYPQHTAPRDTPEGQRMLRAYAQGIAAHLAERGWLDHAYLYVTDEDKSDEVRRTAMQSAATVKSTQPALKTLVLSNAEHRYPDYLDQTDAFGGLISAEHLTRFRAHGGEWWGTYNSGGLPTMPLATTRALGARTWHHGATGYVNWAIWRKPDMLIDTNHYALLPPNAGYPQATFVTDARFDFAGMGTWVYPWPAWEPIDTTRPQSLFVGSLRLAALREAAEDYEYLRLAEALAARQQPDAQGKIPVETVLEAMHELIGASEVRVLKFDYFDVAPSAYHDLRMRLGRLLDDAAPR